MMNKTKRLSYILFLAFALALTGVSSLHAEKGHGKNKMQMMDADGDGAVSKEEFMNHKEEHFNRKDENGDGVLTEDEMKKHCKHKGKDKVIEE